MPIPISIHDRREIHYGALMPGSNASRVFPDEGSLHAAGCFGTVLLKDPHCSEFCIRLSHYFVSSDPGWPPGETTPALFLQFALKGGLNYRLEGARVSEVLQEGEYNFFSLPSLRNINWYDIRNSYTSTLEIYFSAAGLRKAAVEFPPLASLLRQQEKGITGLLSDCPGSLTPAMLRALNEIMDCEFAGDLRRIYMKTKVSELLLMALEKISPPEQKESRIHLKPSDVKCIRESREWLMQHMEAPPTLKQLAHHAGINDFKLKKGYKQLFGITVFNDFHQERMARARKYLLETKMSVMEVAMQSGYQDASNFSRAFKAYYGFTAGKLRKHA